MSLPNLMKNFFGEYWFIILISIPIILYYGYFILRFFYRVEYEKITVGSLEKSLEIHLLSPSMLRNKLLKKILVFLFLFYSASFLAAVLPANPKDPIAYVIYTVGAIIYTCYFLHLAHFIYHYLGTRGLVAYFSKGGISWKKGTSQDTLSLGGKIMLMESQNILFFSDEDNHKFRIPLFLISDKKERDELLSIFQPVNQAVIEKGKQGLDVFESVIIALILAMHIRQFFVQAFYIPSGSMEMTLRIGDHLLVDKISLGTFFPPIFGMKKPLHLKALAFSKIKRGDIIVFYPPIPNEYREFIKRVIALPGDTFEIRDGNVYINDQLRLEPYLNQHQKNWQDYYKFLAKSNPHDIFSSPSCPKINFTEEQSGLHGKIKIPPGKYLMMGDHRDNSSDSRTWGLVPRESIRGKAWILYFNYYDFIKNFDFSRLGFIQ
jgi:signal peptidase I